MQNEPADYFTARTIGTGQSNPGDVRRLRAALKRTGHGHFPGQGAPNVTPGLMDAIKRFQAEFGLEPDAVIRPGGPTERTLSMALHARNHDGEAAMETLRNAFARRADAGLSFRPDPQNRNAGVWQDSDGQTLSDAQSDAVANKTNPKMAMMQRGDRQRRPYRNLLEGGGRYLPRGNIGGRDMLRAITNQALGASGSKEASDGQANDKPGAVKRTVPVKNPEFGTPPRPAKPPAEMETKEARPIEERGPSVTVSPVPEEGRPHIEIFPDQSNIIEQWIVLENSRGKEDGQQKDLQYIIDGLYHRLEQRGLLRFYKHTHGGRIAAGAENANDYMKERTVFPEGGGMTGRRRSDFAYEFDGIIEDLNVVDTLKDNVTPTARERRALKGLIANKKNLEGNGATRSVGKSKGMSWDEFTANADRSLDIIVDEMEKRMRGSDQPN
jgi:hypothetical protein